MRRKKQAKITGLAGQYEDMQNQENHANWIIALKLRWYLIVRDIMSLWVKPRIKADADGNIGTDGDRPVCYVMDTYALTSVLILDKCCEKQGLLRPLLPINGLQEGPPRSFAVLNRMIGLLFRRPTPRRHFKMLNLLVDKTWSDPDFDCLLVPVTVLVGQRPSKESGFTRSIFAENWEIGGRFRSCEGRRQGVLCSRAQASKPSSAR